MRYVHMWYWWYDTHNSFKITFIILWGGSLGLNQGLEHAKPALCYWVTPSATSFSHGQAQRWGRLMISLLLGCYQVCFEIARNLIIKKDKANTGYRITSGPECSSSIHVPRVSVPTRTWKFYVSHTKVCSNASSKNTNKSNCSLNKFNNISLLESFLFYE